MKKGICILTFFSQILISCENDRTRLKDLLKKTDRVTLEKFRGSDTLKCEVTDKTGIKIFTGTIGGEQQDVHTDNASGQIVFLSGGSVIFKASITGNGIQYVFNNYMHKEELTHQADMYFNEASYK